MKRLVVDIEEAGYENRKGIIREIHFEVGEGQMIGLIGPNGAGKSTTIKSILGLLKDVKGTIAFPDGEPHYAYVPEQPVLYENLTLEEHLRLAAASFGMTEEGAAARTSELLRRFRLDHVRNDYPTSFSKGMQQKLMLIIGFLHQPPVYIVDEPFVGLDPRATRDFLEMLEEERRRGAGVLLCTHVLDTAERICDSFLLLSEGSLLASGTLDEVRRICGKPQASLFECFLTLTE